MKMSKTIFIESILQDKKLFLECDIIVSNKH